jgi:hypothetical protein
MVFRGHFVHPCPGPGRGNRNLVVVAEQGAPNHGGYSGQEEGMSIHNPTFQFGDVYTVTLLK